MKIVTGIFTPDAVVTAVHRLAANGFSHDNLSLLTSASAMPAYLEGEPEKAALTGAAVGAVAGGSMGALGTWVAATIPGFEAALLATGVMSTAVGSVIGGYLGSLYTVRADDQTKIDTHEELEAGKILLLVNIDETEGETAVEETAVALLEQSHGEHVESHTIPSEQIESD